MIVMGTGDLDIDDAIASTLTDSSGAYQFNRPNGNYLVEVDLNDSDLTGFSYGGVTGVANDPLNTPRNADIAGANISTGLDFPFDNVIGPPVIDLDGNDSSGATGYDFQNTFTAGGPPVAAADVDVDIEDDGTIITSATITLINRLDGNANETLSIIDGSGITATSYDSGTGTLTLSGNATLADYEAVISTLTYENTVASPTTDTRVVTVQVTDLDGFNSNIAESRIDVRLLTDIVPNPDLTQACGQGLKITLILDSSQSIQGTEVTDTINGITAFLNELASIAPGQVEVGIVEFATSGNLALDFTPVTPTTIANEFNTYLTTSYRQREGIIGTDTNWEAGFQTALSNLGDSDTFLLITDGNPDTVTTNAGTTIGSTVANAIDETIPWSNQAKFQGIHIFAMGVTSDVIIPTNVDDLLEGSGASTQFNGTNGQSADYIGLGDFSELGTSLSSLTTSLCNTNDPNVLLVKRITSINGTQINDGIDLAAYDPDPAFPYDDNVIEAGLYPPDTDKWPNTTGDTSSTFLLGARDGGATEPGEEVEYTIYFLSAGDKTAENVLFCDRIPDGQTFVPNPTFSSLTPAITAAPTSITGEASGILVSHDGNNFIHTNIGGDDNARFYPPGSGLPPACNLLPSQTEHNGAIVVDLGDLTQANTPGSPTDSYGFVRFRTTVNP